MILHLTPGPCTRLQIERMCIYIRIDAVIRSIFEMVREKSDSFNESCWAIFVQSHRFVIFRCLNFVSTYVNVCVMCAHDLYTLIQFTLLKWRIIRKCRSVFLSFDAWCEKLRITHSNYAYFVHLLSSYADWLMEWRPINKWPAAFSRWLAHWD